MRTMGPALCEDLHYFSKEPMKAIWNGAVIAQSDDTVVLGLNEMALRELTCVKALTVVPGATHLFEEPGALEKVADLAREWFRRYLRPAVSAS